MKINISLEHALDYFYLGTVAMYECMSTVTACCHTIKQQCQSVLVYVLPEMRALYLWDENVYCLVQNITNLRCVYEIACGL